MLAKAPHDSLITAEIVFSASSGFVFYIWAAQQRRLTILVGRCCRNAQISNIFG